MNKIELLAPAGDLERLKFAFIYGADAVYIGGERYSLRAAAKNFTLEQINEAVNFAHKLNKKVYIAINIFAHNRDLEGLEEYLISLKNLNVDAFIISDPAIIEVSKKVAPEMEIHLSTQANTTNYLSALFWKKIGIKRVVVARELNFDEIKQFSENLNGKIQLEAFVHGAMCISYSGRCLISNFLLQKDANRGECKHPCRWKYSLVEETRPGEYFPVTEDDRGTYFFNSKDLCMIEYIPQLIESGIRSLKIEGRMKSTLYIATVVGAYRKAIDEYYKNPDHWVFKHEWMDELKKSTHRDFTTGFYFNKPNNEDQRYDSSNYIRDYLFCGIGKGYDESRNLSLVQQRYRMFTGEKVEILGYDLSESIETKIRKMYDDNDQEISVAPNPMKMIKMDLGFPIKGNYIIRKKREE